MRSNLQAATALELQYEGGYVNHPKDPGGPTKFGITIPALAQHRGCACTAADVLAMPVDEAIAIYGAVYWPQVRGDDLPAGVDLICYDTAINMGRKRAGRFLQAAVGLTGGDVDGLIGDHTVALTAAAWSADRAGLIERIRAQRAVFYRTLDTFPTFGTGWLNRLASVAATSTAWAAKA